MKLKILILAGMTSVLFGCGTTKHAIDAPTVEAIGNQKLSSTFNRRSIKLEWDCVWGTGLTDATCVRTQLKAIEVTGYAFSNGNTPALRENAFVVAEMNAKSKLVKFVREDVSSSNVVQTMTKNIEKANDRIKQRIRNDEEVSMSDDEAAQDTNFAIRENTNNIVRTTTETIRSNAQGIITGVRSIKEEIVDRQTVAVTIRWSRDLNNVYNAGVVRAR